MVGDYTPQRYIWRLAIAWMSWLRLFEAVLIYRYFSALRPGASATWRCLNLFTAITHVCENMGLAVLTFVSSTENYGEFVCEGMRCCIRMTKITCSTAVHEGSFIAFLVCGTFNMLSATFLVWLAGPSEGIDVCVLMCWCVLMCVCWACARVYVCVSECCACCVPCRA